MVFVLLVETAFGTTVADIVPCTSPPRVPVKFVAFAGFPQATAAPVQTGWVGTGMSRLVSAASVGGPNAPVCTALRVSMIRQGVIAMKGRGADAAAAASGDRERSVPRRDIMDFWDCSGCQKGAAVQ